MLSRVMSVSLSIAVALAGDHIVLPPVSTSSALPVKLLLFVPGGNVPNDHYRPTVAAIQTAVKDKVALWGVIPSVTSDLCIIECSAPLLCSPLHNTVESALDKAVAQGWNRTDDKTSVYLAGHSLGGVCANTLMQAYAYPYAALLVFGSYIDKTGATDVTEYPTPVLTLNGELDGGMARPGKTSIWWRQYLELEKADASKAIVNKPVIILPSLNHSNFCPGFDVPGDLMAEVTQMEATTTIGQFVGAYLANHILPKPDLADVALLQKGVEWTRSFMAPYLTAETFTVDRAQTKLGEGSSQLCAMAQHTVANLDKLNDARLVVQDGFHVSSPNLEHCHPNYTKTADGRLVLDTCSHTDYYPDIANTGSIEAASEIACKLVSYDRVAEQLNISVPLKLDCRAVNKLVVAMAAEMAAPSTRKRFSQRGKGWCFLPDQETLGDIGPVWVFKDALAVKENATCMTVQSPVLQTTITGNIYPGNMYCKFLTPERALDWMMTDGLK